MPIRTGKLWKPCKKCGKSFEPEGSNPKLCDDCFLKALAKSGKKSKNISEKQQVNLEIDKLIFDYIYSLEEVSDKTYDKIVTEWDKMKQKQKNDIKKNRPEV